MDLITLDFETFYSKDFSLTKLTTEEYIRDIRFEVIGVSIKVNDGYSEWASGTFEQMKEYLHGFDWANSMVLAHNTMFDGAILSWLFDVHPKVWADTLCMARSLHGVEVGGSLSALAQRYQIGEKGTEVLDAIGKHREDFTEKELDKYGDYCINDVELTYKLFTIMSNQYPRQELRVIDTTLRMFIEPMLDLDLGLLEEHLVDIRDRKDALLIEAGASKKSLMSNEKFAGLLRKNGVIPPLKISLVTGKKAYAFAKTDEGFKALQEHPELEIQALVAARLGNKSTLEETRTQRFIDIAKRGLLPVPVRYYAAHTGRWGGDDKINLQNLPSRGPNGKKLKRSMIAPNGCVLIDCDSSQIEARVLAWLAGQDDLVRSFEKGEDVYVKMASRIYSKPEEEITKDERFVGKTTILGSGYGMGAVKFQAQMGTFGFEVDIEEAELMIRELAKGEEKSIGVPQVLKPEGKLSAVRLPSGLLMRYDELEGASNSRGTEYTYKRRNGRAKIYGGKFVENACQALARCIIAEQMLKITKKYRVVLTVHDSVVCCVPEEEVGEAQQYIESCMRTVPDWATGLPLDCESGIGRSYGECE